MTVYDLILEELRYRGCAHVDRFPPYFIASIGTHIFNLRNQRDPILYEAGKVPDLRMHLMFVSPPGFSKTFWIEHFLRGPSAILYDSGVDIGFEGFMTEAGFIGTFEKIQGGMPFFKPGAAREFSEAILGIEEFSAVLQAMKLQHSTLLDTAMLTALDSGYVNKRLASGKISYKTNITLWTGTQPARFDLTSGLGRRFFFIEFIPRKRDFQIIKHARRRAKGRIYDDTRLRRIRYGIRRLISELNVVKEVSFPESFYKWLDDQRIIHYEEILYERSLLGLSVMRSSNFHYTLEVEFDRDAQTLLRRAIFWRDSIRRGSEFAEVLSILRDNRGKMSVTDLKQELLRFGLDWSQATTLIQEMCRTGLLRIRGSLVELP